MAVLTGAVASAYRMIIADHRKLRAPSHVGTMSSDV